MTSSGHADAETSLTRPHGLSRSTARKCAPSRAPGGAMVDRSNYHALADDAGFADDDDSSASSSSSLSDSSIELDSGASSHDPRATPPAARSSNLPPPASTPFRPAIRPARARQHVQAGAPSPPKTPRTTVDPAAVSRNHPLPHPHLEFNILNHAPTRHPAPPPGWKDASSRTAQQEADAARRAAERRKRVEEQRTLREPEGARWEWIWARDELEVPKPSNKGKGKEKETLTVRPFSPSLASSSSR